MFVHSLHKTTSKGEIWTADVNLYAYDSGIESNSWEYWKAGLMSIR